MPLLTTFGSGAARGFGRGTSQSIIWGSGGTALVADNQVYQFSDVASGQTFYSYVRTWNGKKALAIMAGRQTGSGSQFYYSNSWWSNKSKLNDNATAANVYSNSSTNFVSEAFFRVPIKGAFATIVRDSSYINSFIEYSGTFSSLSNIGTGGYTNYYSTPANNVGLQAIARGGELTSVTTSTPSSVTLRDLGVFDGTSNINTLSYKSTDGNSSYRPGNANWLSFDPDSAYAHSSNSRARVRLGIVRAQEAYLSGSYSARAAGFGPAADDQDGNLSSPGIQVSSGWTNARSNASNQGVFENGAEATLELWIIPQDSWEFNLV
jgi:hypothetical protein